MGYMNAMRGDLAVTTPSDPAKMKPPERADLSALLSWLDRFFQEGGDIVPTDHATAAATGAGPWVASAYLRSVTPIALTPDSAGRLTYFHQIPDLWGHTYRYYLRPQGRYDLIWESLSKSSRLFCNSLGDIAKEQAKIERPAAGGLDVVLDAFARWLPRSFSPRSVSILPRRPANRFPPARSGRSSSPSTQSNRSSRKIGPSPITLGSARSRTRSFARSPIPMQ